MDEDFHRASFVFDVPGVLIEGWVFDFSRVVCGGVPDLFEYYLELVFVEDLERFFGREGVPVVSRWGRVYGYAGGVDLPRVYVLWFFVTRFCFDGAFGRLIDLKDDYVRWLGELGR